MPLSSLIGSIGSAADSTLTAVADSTIKSSDLLSKVTTMSSEELVSWGIKGLVGVGIQILLAVLLYIVGRWIIRRVVKVMKRIFENRKVDVSLAKFIVSMVNIVFSAILILTVVGILGINTTSFLAIFASAGLAIGMALSGTLQNFAGGILILFLKPFKVGDVIEAQGYTGSVKEISLFSTLLNTIDNKMIIVPNGPLSTGTINNYSKEERRRVDWVFGVSYGTDYDKVKEVILDVVGSNSMVLKDVDLVVLLKAMADSSVNVEVRAWCMSQDYWTLYFEINEAIYKRFNSEGIEFPFPQIDVHLNK